MRRVKPIKIKYKYVGDKSSEERERSEKILEEVYDRLFTMAFKKLKEEKPKENNK